MPFQSPRKSSPETIAKRLANLDEAFGMAIEEMHRCDGTQPGNPMGSRSMSVALTHLQTAQMWAKRAVEED